MRYSEEFRNKVVSRLLAKELRVREAAEQYDVSEFTLYEWKRKALAAVQTDAGEHNGAPVTMDKLLSLIHI